MLLISFFIYACIFDFNVFTEQMFLRQHPKYDGNIGKSGQRSNRRSKFRRGQ